MWLVNGERSLKADALAAIANSQRDGALYVSPMTGWELSVASQKSTSAGRPDLGGQSARAWFREALTLTTAKLIPISQGLLSRRPRFPSIMAAETRAIAS